ncbi:MAG: hypothetical protein NTY07_01855 [Bacteroidia bacterium]|nr:hypothetical protein [Bacteroidia bacterium]
MKKLALSIMAAFLVLSFIPTQLKAATDNKTVSLAAPKTVESADANLARLEEIKTMDMSTLNRSEKKELRKEVRAIKDDQDGRGRGYQNGRGRRYHDGGNSGNVGVRGGGTIYIMGGGGLLIILLIILLI